MIAHYLRPDGAHMKVDDTALVVINVLDRDDAKFIGRFSKPDYVNAILADVARFTPIDEATFVAKFNSVKQYINGL